MKAIKQLMSWTKSGTARDSGIFFFGNLANTTLSFLAVLIISRHLGPSGFGIIAVFNSVLVLVIGLTDLGLNTTSIRLIAGYRAADTHKASVTMNVIVRIELLVGALVLLIGAIAATPIAGLLGGSQFEQAVRLGFIAGAFASAAAFFGPFFVAYRQYWRNAALNFASFLARTGLIIALLLTASLSLSRVMGIYTLVPIGFFAIGWFFIPRDFLIKTSRTERQRAYADVFHYSKWIFLSLLATGAIARLDVLFLTHYHGSQPAGLYYAAQQLVTFMPLVITALTTVLLQRISSLDSKRQADYLKNASGAVLAIAIVLLPALVVAPFAINLIFGSAYAPAVTPFRLLLIAQLINLLAVPFSVWFLGRNQPVKTTIAAGLQLAVAISLYFALIPRYGAAGAATAAVISSLVAFIVLGTLTYRSGSKLTA